MEQELQKALGTVRELEQVCSERDMLLEQEKASTTSLQQQINETKGAHSEVYNVANIPYFDNMMNGLLCIFRYSLSSACRSLRKRTLRLALH